jgi:hypothetical protein
MLDLVKFQYAYEHDTGIILNSGRHILPTNSQAPEMAGMVLTQVSPEPFNQDTKPIYRAIFIYRKQAIKCPTKVLVQTQRIADFSFHWHETGLSEQGFRIPEKNSAAWKSPTASISKMSDR